MLFNILIFFATFVLSLQDNYSDANLKNWACTDGRRQSPISLSDQKSNYTQNVSIVYEDYNALSNVFLTFNSDNILEINDKATLLGGSTDKGYLVIDYSGYYFKYNLAKIEVFSPSQHQINGTYPDIEVQFIHKKDFSYTTDVNDYKVLPDISHYLVISVFYAVNGTESDTNFLNNLVYSTSISSTSLGTSLDIFEYGLIKDKKFFFYRGSDTITPCSESHLYYVVADIYKLNQSKVNTIKGAYTSKYGSDYKLKSLANLNGRYVYRNFFADQAESDAFFKTNEYRISDK